jgi:acyl-CoA thioesterase II
MSLELDTRVEGGNGRYQAEISRKWEVWGPNGGYLASLALRAAGMEAEIKRPSSLYCHFLVSPQFGQVQLDVDVLRRGRRSESISVCMKQNDRPVLQALIRTAASAPGYEHQQVVAPAAPLPESLKSWGQLFPNYEGPRYSFWENVDSRPLDQRIGADRKSENAVRQEWVKFIPQACFDDPFVDAARALILLDTYGYPAAFERFGNGGYIAPNLDTSMWFHRSSRESDWLLIDHSCPTARDGLIFANGNVWDRSGNLIANGSAHLCCLPGKT